MSLVFGQVEPAVFQAYAFWAAVLALKMLVMSILTGMQRGSKKVFSNPEDVKPGGTVAYNDPDVERVRRAHRNDMENILPYFIVGFLYMFTSPSVFVATNLFRLVAAVRISHTVFHALVPVAKFRGLSWAVGFFTTAFMAVRIVLHFL
ncbi:prostaglandin E synthase-like [Anopheles ziemanni]|uniref:prostaglandin E synthase-like n=1 Tax=Anopheles coustani TaxID=139045 RepID=UPI002657CE75|nr:prostaglandin E synthase-like [Anopheles coustani]XP_058166747.1 prostaglandin E synthase-like [Anopheles ziemanni]